MIKLDDAVEVSFRGKVVGMQTQKLNGKVWIEYKVQTDRNSAYITDEHIHPLPTPEELGVS